MTPRMLFTPLAILGSLAAMAAIGALTAAYGPVIPGFIARFDIDASAAGAGLAVQSLGAVVGVLASPKMMRAYGNRVAMIWSLVLIVLGAVTLTLAPTWTVVLISAAVIGLGLGGVDLMVTQLLIFGTGWRGPFLVNVAHGLFGLGTVAAPGLVAAIGAEYYGILFALIGATAVLALTTMSGLSPRPTPADRPAERPRRALQRRSLVGAGILGGFVVLYITHFGVQSGIGNWEPTYLAGIGYADSTAALATAGFWFAMVLGRFIAAFLTRIMTIPSLVIISCIGMVVSLIPAFHEDLVIWSLIACGFFIGPIFPNGLTWLAQSGHGHGERFAYVMAASMVGMAVTPWVLGVGIDQAGLGIIPPVLLGIAAVALIAAVGLYFRTRTPVTAHS